MPSEELKPCPFCGYALTTCEGICEGYVDGSEEEEVEFTGICCPGCAVFLPKQTENGTAVEGIQAWNRRAEAALSSEEPVAAMTKDYLGCEYVSMDVAGIEKIAAAHSKGPTEVVYLYAAPPASAAVKPLQWSQMDDGETYHAQSILGRWARWEGHYLPPDGYGGIACADPVAAAQADYEARIRPALSPQVQDVAVPEGWKLVPKEPTEEMHNAARDWAIEKYGMGVGTDGSDGCYRAMIAAAPVAEGNGA